MSMYNNNNRISRGGGGLFQEGEMPSLKEALNMYWTGDLYVNSLVV